MAATEQTAPNLHPDVVLIGAGVMSATLGVLLKQLEPSWTINIYERLDAPAEESSDAWNNAGTGHSAFCELNYTPEKEDGSIDLSKAVKVASQFEVSRELWAWLVESGLLVNPNDFIRNVPHISFVWGAERVAFLRKRYQAMIEHSLFIGMEYTEDHEILREWMPLIMEGRSTSEKLAATRMQIGTDVNFGELTRQLMKHLVSLPGVAFLPAHEVRDIDEEEDDNWYLKIKNLQNGNREAVSADFVFIGAGGAALGLLEESGIPEGRGYGGFPVGGQWLVCTDEEVVTKHAAKVYGMASVGSPPMSVPHLDTRVIAGKKSLLFGPYASFSTRFLKHGSLMDLPASINLRNLVPMISAGLHNIPLTKYLIDQVSQSPEERMDALRQYYPDAKLENWKLQEAGQRVQVIKKDDEEGGVLEFGTEIVCAANGSIAALLGASPGASTSVAIMLELLQRCFPEKMKTDAWQSKLKEMILSYGSNLSTDGELVRKSRIETAATLGLIN